MGRRTQHAPKLGTIAVALVLVLVGVLGTFADLLPDIAGITGERIGVGAFIAATVVLLLGIFFEGI
jgi:hypothetical protein